MQQKSPRLFEQQVCRPTMLFLKNRKFVVYCYFIIRHFAVVPLLTDRYFDLQCIASVRKNEPYFPEISRLKWQVCSEIPQFSLYSEKCTIMAWISPSKRAASKQPAKISPEPGIPGSFHTLNPASPQHTAMCYVFPGRPDPVEFPGKWRNIQKTLMTTVILTGKTRSDRIATNLGL